MFKVEFALVHNNCPTNQMSRALPHIRFISPGGFVVGDGMVEEVAAVHKPSDADVQAVLDYLGSTPGYEEFEVLERTPQWAFIRWMAACSPQGFCSQIVEKNRGFKIGMEIQHGGLERWTVACMTRAQAGQLLEDLQQLGDVQSGTITETTWEHVFDPVPIDADECSSRTASQRTTNPPRVAAAPKVHPASSPKTI